MGKNPFPDPPKDAFDPQPNKGSVPHVPTPSADKPNPVKETTTQADAKEPRAPKVSKPTKTRKARAVAVDQSQKVQQAAVDALKSDAENLATDRGPEQAVDDNRMPPGASDGATVEQERSQPPEPPEVPAPPTPPLRPRRAPQRKDDAPDAKPQATPEAKPTEAPKDAAAKVDASEKKAESGENKSEDTLRAILEVMIEIRNDQRELLLYARESSTKSGGLGSNP